MKVFFGIDVTKNKKNESYDGEIFIGKRLPEALAKSMDSWEASSDALEEKRKLPLVLRIIQVAAFAVAAICFLAIVRSDVSIFQGYRNAPWAFYACGIGAVVWAVLTLLGWLRGRQASNSEEAAVSNHRLQNLKKSCYDALEVPDSAPFVDILVMRYKNKKGKPVPAPKTPTVFLNPELRIFVQDNKLCLADLYQRFDIPLEEIDGIHRMDARGTAPLWNKTLSFSDEPYKSYKITSNQYGIIFKPYYALFVRRDGVTYALFFPPYELPTFQSLTGCGIV